jgi:predicted nucleic acid-binding protein
LSAFFVDTSAVAKRYISEAGTAWVLSWILPSSRNVIIIAEIASVEIVSLLTRRQNEGTIDTEISTLIQGNFLLHVEEEYLIVPIESAMLVDARELIRKYKLRILDSIQLVSAIRAKALLSEPITFVSADKNLLAAAAAEGFAVDNPNDHP